MNVSIIPVTPLEQNCSLLCCEASGKAAVVDPGGDLQRILAAAREAGVEIEKILLTHGHFDHAGAAGRMARELGVPIEGPHEDDRFLLESLPEWCERFGFPPGEAVNPDRWLVEGDRVTFGEQELEERRREQDHRNLKPEPGWDRPPVPELDGEAEVAPEAPGPSGRGEGPHRDQVPAGLACKRCRDRHDVHFRTNEDEDRTGRDERTDDTRKEHVEHLRQAPLDVLEVVAHLRSDRCAASRSNRIAR